MKFIDPFPVQSGWRLLLELTIDIQAGWKKQAMSEFMTRLKQLDWYLNIPARLPEIISGEIEKIYERQSKLEAWARFSVRILVSVSKDVSTDAGNSGPTSVSAQKTDNKAWGFFIINRMSGGQNPGQINFDVYIYEE